MIKDFKLVTNTQDRKERWVVLKANHKQNRYGSDGFFNLFSLCRTDEIWNLNNLEVKRVKLMRLFKEGDPNIDYNSFSCIRKNDEISPRLDISAYMALSKFLKSAKMVYNKKSGELKLINTKGNCSN